MVGTLASIGSDRARLLRREFSSYQGPSFALRLWDGWSWTSSEQSPACTLVLRSPHALRTLLLAPSELSLAEAFIDNEIDVTGDMFAVFDVAQHVFASSGGKRRRVIDALAGLWRGVVRLSKEGARHSQARDKAAIARHYDQPVDFYRPWLGESLVYSCGYFESPDDDLATAQHNKLELICRKLRLCPEDRFLDLGCGWGSLVMHAASQHTVYARGITISREQASTAAKRIEESRFTQSCRVELLDYREARQHLGTFDKIASVGMFEHVGVANLPAYFRTVYDMLKPGGAFLNHGIAHSATARFQNSRMADVLNSRVLQRLPLLRRLRDPSFIDRYVFPDGELATISEAESAAEEAGFEVRDVENLREHYELTLRAWVDGLQNNARQLLALVPQATYRIWLLYMAGCAAAFRRGEIAVYQMLLSRPDHGRSGLPMTREDWYRA